MPTGAIKEFLQSHKVNYTSILHPIAYSAKEVSHASHIPENQLAKTVIVYAGNKMIMVVIPCNQNIDFNWLKKALHEKDLTLTPENDFKALFPDCEIGAMPPFGNLYNMDVYVEKSLSKNKEIAFNAGTHTEVIKLSYQDFESLVHPKMIASDK